MLLNKTSLYNFAQWSGSFVIASLRASVEIFRGKMIFNLLLVFRPALLQSTKAEFPFACWRGFFHTVKISLPVTLTSSHFHLRLKHFLTAPHYPWYFNLCAITLVYTCTHTHTNSRHVATLDEQWHGLISGLPLFPSGLWGISVRISSAHCN